MRAVDWDPFHHPREPGNPVPGVALKAPILAALNRLDWAKLTESQRLDLVRVYGVLFNRLEWPDRETRAKLVQRFDPFFPANSRELNAEQFLVYLEAPGISGKLLQLIAQAPTQEEQLEYARSLRVLETGWTPEQHNAVFHTVRRNRQLRRRQQPSGLPQADEGRRQGSMTKVEKEGELKPVLEARAAAPTPIVGKTRPFVKKWKLDELAPIVEKG